MGVCLVLAESIGNFEGYTRIKELQVIEDNGIVLKGIELAKACERMVHEYKGQYYVYADEKSQNRFLRQYMSYVSDGKIVFSKNEKNMKGSNIYVYTKSPVKFADVLIENVAEFEHEGEIYYLLYIRKKV